MTPPLRSADTSPTRARREEKRTLKCCPCTPSCRSPPTTASCAAARIPEELVLQAIELGHTAIGITDRNTLAGVVRAYAPRTRGIRFEVRRRAAAIRETDQASGRQPPRDARRLFAARLSHRPRAYRRLCRLLTVGKRRAAKGQCDLTFDDLAGPCRGPDRHRPAAAPAGRAAFRERCARSPAGSPAAAISPPRTCFAATTRRGWRCSPISPRDAGVAAGRDQRRALPRARAARRCRTC